MGKFLSLLVVLGVLLGVFVWFGGVDKLVSAKLTDSIDAELAGMIADTGLSVTPTERDILRVVTDETKVKINKVSKEGDVLVANVDLTVLDMDVVTQQYSKAAGGGLSGDAEQMELLLLSTLVANKDKVQTITGDIRVSTVDGKLSAVLDPNLQTKLEESLRSLTAVLGLQ